MTPWVTRLIVVNVLMFLFQENVRAVESVLQYVPRYALREPWTVVTYMFLHGGFMHLLFNMLGLYFFGPRVESRLGSNKFITMYLVAGITGALLSTLFAPRAAIIGASAGVFGVMMAYAVFWPREQIMIWGIIPMEVWMMITLTTIFAIFSGATGSRRGVADFAHLGGFLGGYLYLYFLKQTAGNKRFRAKIDRPPPGVEKKLAANIKNVDLTGVHELSKEEVNRILDKISAQGIGSLTTQEKVFLSNFVPLDDRKPIS